MVSEQWLAYGWYLVNAPIAPRVTAKHPPPCQHRTAQGAVPPHRLVPIVGAGRVVLAGGANQGRDSQLVHANESHEKKPGEARDERDNDHASAFARARRKPPATSAFSSSKPTVAAAGSARNTTREPCGRCSNSSAMMARKRRVTRLRTTAPPTARETAKPVMLFASPVFARYTTAVRVPALAPVRMTRRKSSPRRSRRLADSTTPTERRDPYDDGPSKWFARHGYACAGGNRASWHACGCSAEKSACSRGNSTTVGMVK